CPKMLTCTTAARCVYVSLLLLTFIWHIGKTARDYLAYPVVVYLSFQHLRYYRNPYFSLCFDLREYISSETVGEKLTAWERGNVKMNYTETELKCFRTSKFYSKGMDSFIKRRKCSQKYVYEAVLA